MTTRLTKKLKRSLEQRALEGAIRQILLLNPQYDRPGFVDIDITIKPVKQAHCLRISASYALP